MCVRGSASSLWLTDGVWWWQMLWNMVPEHGIEEASNLAFLVALLQSLDGAGRAP